MNYNIINEYISFSKICINKYLKKILGKHYNQNIVNRLLKVYVNSRYYDVYLSSGKDFANNIRENLVNLSENLKKQEDVNQVDYTIESFEYIFYFDNVIECESINDKITEIENFRKDRLNINRNKKFNIDLFETIKEDLIKKKEYIETIDNKKFEFNYELTNLNNIYDVQINQNLKFPAVYNSAIVDKIFKSSELSQRKAAIEFSFAALKVLKDVIKGNFNYKYLVKYPSGVSSKKMLTNKLFSILDNDMLREKVIIKLDYNDFKNEKESIYEKIRKGFKFAIILNDDFVEEEDNIKLLYIFKYILVKKDTKLLVEKRYNNIINI